MNRTAVTVLFIKTCVCPILCAVNCQAHPCLLWRLHARLDATACEAHLLGDVDTAPQQERKLAVQVDRRVKRLHLQQQQQPSNQATKQSRKSSPQLSASACQQAATGALLPCLLGAGLLHARASPSISAQHHTHLSECPVIANIRHDTCRTHTKSTHIVHC